MATNCSINRKTLKICLLNNLKINNFNLLLQIVDLKAKYIFNSKNEK